MNKVYRVIWNNTQRCLVVVSELASGRGKSNKITGNIPAVVSRLPGLSLLTSGGILVLSSVSHASNPQVVDNITRNFSYTNVLNAGPASAMIVKGAAGNVTFTDGFISASAPLANAVQVQDGATFDVRNSEMQTFMAPTMSALGGSSVSLTNSDLQTIAGATALVIGENTSVSGSDVRVKSSKAGMLVDNSSVDITGLRIETIGSGGGNTTGITASSDSQLFLTTVSIDTGGANGHGMYIDNSAMTGNNIVINTSGSSARGILASGDGAHLKLNGGTITTQGFSAHAVQATAGAQVEISNMDLATSALLEAGSNGAAAIFADSGAVVKAESMNLTSAANAIWIDRARVEGKQLNIQHTTDSYGPMVWARSGSHLSLTGSSLKLGEEMDKSEGIYADASTAHLDGVSISGNSGGTAITLRDDSTLTANNIVIGINNANGLFASGVFLSQGTGNNLAILENSTIAVNGSNAAGLRSDVSGAHTVTLRNTLLGSDNIVATADGNSSLKILADASTLRGRTLLQGGIANSTAAVVDFVSMHATNGSSLSGDASIDTVFTRDSQILLDTASVWEGAASGLHQLDLNNNSRWLMTASSDVNNVTLAGSQIAYDFRGGAFKTLTISGNFHGEDGSLVLSTMLDGDGSPHDKLVVEGNTSGTAQVVVNKAGGQGAQTLQGIELISVAGNSDGVFTQKGRVVAGAFDYQLQRGVGSNEKNWYLMSGMIPNPEPGTDPGIPSVGGEGEGGGSVVSPLPVEKMTLRPEAGNYIANMSAANTLFNLRLRDRGTESQYVDALTGEFKSTSLWMRNTGGHQKQRDSTGQLSVEANRYVLQLGGDLAAGSFSGNDRMHLGAMAGYASARSNTDSRLTGYRSQGHTTGYNLGLYSSWFQNSDEQTGTYLDSWLQYSWFNNSVNGEQLSAARYKSRGFTASLEGGYSWKFGEDSFRNSYFIEPNAQVIWMDVKADDVTEANGTRVSGKGDGNVESRVGLRVSMKTSGEKNQTLIKPYLEVNWINNSKQFGSTLDGVTVQSPGRRNIAELRLGLDGQVTSGVSLWGIAGQQMSNNHYRDSSAAVGVKIKF